MHSFLVIGSDSQARQEYINTQSRKLHIVAGSVYIIEDKPVTIGAVRTVQHFLSRTAAGDLKFAALIHAETLTAPAQHALLKTLEEPPAHSVIYFAAPSTEFFLPTILSRCQIIRLAATRTTISPEKQQELLTWWKKTIETEPLKRLAFTPNVGKTREEYHSFINDCVYMLDTMLKQTIDAPNAQVDIHRVTQSLKLFLRASKHLSSNSHLQLTLDQVLLQL